MKEEGRWRVLCDSDMETFLNGCSLMSSTKSKAVRVICDGPWKLVPALMLFALSFPRSFELVGFLESWALAPHATALVKLTMNLLFVQGLRDVSLSFCLFADSVSTSKLEHQDSAALLTVVALGDSILNPSTLG